MDGAARARPRRRARDAHVLARVAWRRRRTQGARTRIQIVPSAGPAEFLDLPWSTPLAEWPSELLVHVTRGLGRHVVRFVERGGTLFALKELQAPLAEREYRLLRQLAVEGVPAVDGVGVVCDRRREGADDPLADIVVTRYLEFSLPLRVLLARRPLPELQDRLLDAFVELLVRLHLAGFFWGDCSLSNTLFRRDAGALAAALVDAETCERHARLTDGQRAYDLQIAEENVFGELLDVEAQAGDGSDAARDPAEIVAEIRTRYERLWLELTAEEVFGPHERHRLAERLRRLNELGFDAEEIEIVSDANGFRLRLDPGVVESGHHRRRLARLTGLVAQENQARRLLGDIESFRRALEERGQRFVSEAAAAGRWLSEVFEPAVAGIPAELHGKRDAAEVFHELLEHRWLLSERAGREVGLDEAVRSYVDTVLRQEADERAIVSDGRE